MTEEYFFELSGEHPTMPAAEALACICAESDMRESEVKYVSGPGYVTAQFDERIAEGIAERIALTQKIGKYLGSFDAGDVSFEDIVIPEGTFAVRPRRFRGMMQNVDSQDLARKLGKHLSKNNEVSLNDPDIEVRVFMSDKIHIFLSCFDIDRSSFEDRKVGERPFFSPISLHPKYARASVNLTRVKKGDVVIDPFCGTGGIVMEAAVMGMKVIASDLDERMVTGCLENMEHYGLKIHDSDVLDIGDVPGRFGDADAVVTDPPYGRSTHTAGEDVKSIHLRALSSVNGCLKNGGRAAIVLPYEVDTDSMTKEHMFTQRVHGSLCRHYHVFAKR